MINGIIACLVIHAVCVVIIVFRLDRVERSADHLWRAFIQSRINDGDIIDYRGDQDSLP